MNRARLLVVGTARAPGYRKTRLRTHLAKPFKDSEQLKRLLCTRHRGLLQIMKAVEEASRRVEFTDSGAGQRKAIRSSNDPETYWCDVFASTAGSAVIIG